VSPSSIPVLHRADGWIAVDKPAGLETIREGGGGPERCLTLCLRAQEGAPYAPAHRLDRDTSGVQVFALPAALAALESAFRHRRVAKRYLALCLGVPRNPEGTIRRPLSAWSGGRRPVRAVKGGGGMEAETSYRVLSTGGVPAPGGEGIRVSLVLFEPHQGRTHQIRVHAEAIGYPVIGDDQYGDRPANAVFRAYGLCRQALHAWRLTIEDPASGREVGIEAPIPADMRAAAEGAKIRTTGPLLPPS